MIKFGRWTVVFLCLLLGVVSPVMVLYVFPPSIERITRGPHRVCAPSCILMVPADELTISGRNLPNTVSELEGGLAREIFDIAPVLLVVKWRGLKDVLNP